MAEQGGGGEIGYGQFSPTDAGAEANVMAFIVRQMLGEVGTMKIVKIVAVHPGEASGGGVAPPGTVDVLPLVNQLDGNGNATKHGTVFGLPWLRLGGGKNAVALDPEVDDIGIAIVSDRDISNVKANKKQSNPGSLRKFDVTDGIYVGAILSAAPEQYVVFSADGIKIKDKTGNIVEMKQGGVFVTGNLVVNGNLLLTGDILGDNSAVYAGNLRTSGDVIAHANGASVGLSTHTHTQPNDSHGDTEQPTAGPTGGT